MSANNVTSLAERKMPKSRLRAMLGTISNRVLHFGRLFGKNGTGTRDYYEVFGWSRKVGYDDFLEKYNRQDIARRIIRAPVEGCWADPPKVDGGTTFNTAWDDIVSRSRLYYNIQRLDRLAGLGKYAVMVIGYDDSLALDQPVRKRRSDSEAPRQITYLQPYGEGSVQIKEWELEPTNPRFGLPKVYTINPGLVDASEAGTAPASAMVPGRNTFDVHWTRLLHVAEDCLEDPSFGRSRLECVYNVLDDLLKVTGGAAESFWLTGNRGLHIDLDKEMDLEGEDEDALTAEVSEYVNQMTRVLRTRGVKVQELGTSTADPSNVFDVLLSLIAAATGIPKRVLLGTEAGQLSSQQDRANWATQIEARISDYAQPVVLLPFIVMQVRNGVLPVPESLTITWPEAFKLNPLERGQTSAQIARSAANLVKVLTKPAPEPVMDQIAAPTQTGSFNATKPSPAKSDTSKPEPKMVKVETVQTYEPFITPEEARTIISFGKHPPVFDSVDDTHKFSVFSNRVPTKTFEGL